jgi:hypothetical protein
MIAGNWCLYERRSNRWLFHRRKRLLGAPLLTVMAVLALSASAWLGWY